MERGSKNETERNNGTHPWSGYRHPLGTKQKKNVMAKNQEFKTHLIKFP